MRRYHSMKCRRRLLEAAKRHIRLMSPEEVMAAQDHTGLIPLKHLPKLEQIMAMSYVDLEKVLLMCPYSDYFAWS